MAQSNDTRIMAVFCDFENVALGVRDANYEQFSIQKVLERLLLKGNIVVKKAYCDWARYKDFKAGMHEASFELIEIPHVRQSGKNSADIRMVVDALDLCYTKGHVDTFVIISGDSDFSPLVSKLRENNKVVIGVGVKNSTSDLLIANCDEFIFYDDLARKPPQRTTRPRAKSAATPAGVTTLATTLATTSAATAKSKGRSAATRENIQVLPKQEAWDLAVLTYEALLEERGEAERIWGSMIKQALRRRMPGFSERQYGFRSFNELLEQAQTAGVLELDPDERSGGFVVKGVTGNTSKE